MENFIFSFPRFLSFAIEENHGIIANLRYVLLFDSLRIVAICVRLILISNLIIITVILMHIVSFYLPPFF